MKYRFIINPKAGSSNYLLKIKDIIENYFKESGEDYEITETEYKGHAEELVKAEAEKGEPVRVYGFGGDGTLLELVRGAAYHDNVEIGIFPVGSGNDYVKSFGDKEAFMSFENQLKGESIYVDGIESENGCAVNICSLGLDANVAYNMVKFKKVPMVSGPLAYDLSLVKCLMSKIGEDLKVMITTKNGEINMEGTYLFALAACGRYYGGGYMGAPKAVLNDGELDFVLIKKPPLYKIPKFAAIYKKGEHIGHPALEEYLTFVRGYEMEVEAAKPAVCNYDGECVIKDREKFTIAKNMVKFILPKGVTYRPDKNAEE